MRQDLEHCGAAEHGGRLPLPALHGEAAAEEEGAGEAMRAELMAAIAFILAIGYAALSLGAEEKVLRLVYFVFAVACMVVGAANLI